MEAAVSAGLLIGAVIAINLAWISGHGLPAILLRGALGMFIGAVFAALIAASRAVPGPVPVPARDDLWDRWLDAEAVVEADPGIAFIADLPAPALIPRRAAVRPRVISPEIGESMRLEDEILPFARRGEARSDPDRGTPRIGQDDRTRPPGGRVAPGTRGLRAR